MLLENSFGIHFLPNQQVYQARSWGSSCRANFTRFLIAVGRFPATRKRCGSRDSQHAIVKFRSFRVASKWFFSPSPFDSVSRATRKPVGDVKLFPRIWIPRGSVSSCRVSPAVFQLHANMANCRQSFCAYLHTPPRCYLASASRVPGRSCARSLWKMCAKKRRLLGFHPILTREIYQWKIREIVSQKEKREGERKVSHRNTFSNVYRAIISLWMDHSKIIFAIICVHSSWIFAILLITDPDMFETRSKYFK